MKKLLILVLLALLSCSLLFAAPEENNERSWCDITNLGLINLENIFYLPKYSRAWVSGEKYDINTADPDEGTYITGVNILGKIGCAYCDHNLKFTVDTNGGRFVSVSDPTKYRDFSVALFPRARDNNDHNYYWEIEEGQPNNGGHAIPHETRLPNTRSTGTVSVISPAFTLQNKTIPYDNPATINCVRWWLDMVLVLDPLTTEDKMHLPKETAEKEEFVATISVEWHCLDPNCDGEGRNAFHNGNYTFVVLGYYGKKPDASQVSMFVTPDDAASNLDIINILGQSGEGEQHLAGLNLYSVSGTADWNGKVSCYLSSSAAYDSNNAQSFALVGPSHSIPYTVKVVNGDGSGEQVFTGAASYPACKEGPAGNDKRIDITSSVEEMPDRQGNYIYMLQYAGDVYIELSDPGAVIRNNMAAYSGIYRSSIWYHLVVD